jgi:hypothetical protein
MSISLYIKDGAHLEVLPGYSRKDLFYLKKSIFLEILELLEFLGISKFITIILLIRFFYTKNNCHSIKNKNICLNDIQELICILKKYKIEVFIDKLL